MDPYKIVTAGSEDNEVDVWETDTGRLTTCLPCSSFPSNYGCSAMAVDGCRIVSASFNEEEQQGVLRFRDFSNSSCEIVSDDSGPTSKFWGPQSSSDDSDESEYG